MPSKPGAEYAIRAKDESAAGWRSALSTADKNAKKLRSTLAGTFAGFSVGTLFVSEISKAIKFGDEMGKLAIKIGATASATQELVAVARQFDIEAESLATSLRKMQVSISEATTGNKALNETFAALGLNAATLKRLSPDKQFEVIGDAISRLRSEEDRARAATDIFGRSGTELLPAFAKGADGIRQARAEVQQFGQILDDAAIKKLQEADDAMKKISAAWDSIWRHLAVGVVSYGTAVGDTTEKIKDLLTQQGPLASFLRGVGATSIPIIGPLLLGAEAQSRADAANDYTRGGGSSRGRRRRAASPGFGGAAEPVDAFTPEMRRAIRAADEWRKTIGEADEATRKFIEGTVTEMPEVFDDIEEPVLRLSDSLIQADELQKEFTRSMFQNFSDLFMEIGNGTDAFAQSMINAFKRILSDRATLALFDALGSLGSSLTGSSGGKGIGGLIGAGLTSLFGGTKAAGGPMQSGKWYIAGEHGPEAIWGGGGAYAMGYGGGGNGGGGVSISTHIDARGASVELISRLPAVLKANNEQLEAKIASRMRRGYYGNAR
jgi:hypothetical protein